MNIRIKLNRIFLILSFFCIAAMTVNCEDRVPDMVDSAYDTGVSCEIYQKFPELKIKLKHSSGKKIQPLYIRVDDMKTMEDMWWIDFHNESKAISVIDYGTENAGYKERFLAKKLVPGRKYVFWIILGAVSKRVKCEFIYKGD